MTAHLTLQSSQFVNLRVTFKNSPIHVLEKFTFKDIYKAYTAFIESKEIEECIILQTCNRVEIYGVGSNPLTDKIIELWSNLIYIPIDEVKSNIIVDVGEEAINILLN